MTTNNREYYRLLVANHVCTRCGMADAATGRTKCTDCAAKTNAARTAARRREAANDNGRERKPLPQRFFARVTKTDGCWIWSGAVSNGYGHMLGAAGTSVSAHRVSYEIHIGAIPANGRISHTCTVKICVNPAHLFLLG